MKTGERLGYFLSLLLLCWWFPDSADGLELNDNQKIGLYTGVAVGGGVLLIVIIVLLVVCCRTSKKDRELKKKRKWDYQQFTEPSTLQSLYHTSKSPAAEIPKANGHVHDKHLSNGKVVTGKAVPKIGRSRSDAYDQRGHVVPEWRRQQDKRDGVNTRHSNGSDGSVPTGIWTSNPTLTQGLYPSYVMVTPSGNAKGHLGVPYGSAPALHAQRSSKKSAKSKPHRASGSVDNSIWDRSKSTKIGQPSRRDLDKVQEDTKELLPGSSSEDTNSERDNHTVARAYSNAAYKSDKPATSPAKSPGQEGPFVAKIYSDYQQPKDFLPRTKPDKETGKVAKVFSSYGSDSTSNRNSTPDSFASSRCSTSQAGSPGVHVARVTVSQSSSLDSSGEPKYAKPQDALNKMTHSDWILYTKKDSRPIERSQSSKEKTKRYYVPLESKIKKAQRSSSHVVGKNGVNGNHPAHALTRSSTDVQGSFTKRHGNGVYMRNTTDHHAHGADKRRPVSVDSGKIAKDRDNKSKRNSSAANKLKNKPKKSSKADSKVRNNNNVVLNVKAADEINPNETTSVPPAPDRPVPPAPVHAPTPVRPQSLNVSESLELRSNPSNDVVVRPISESSSADDDTVVEITKPATPIMEQITVEEDPNAIYAAPAKNRSRPNSTFVEIPPDSPMSPRPPPVPPITKLREECVTPLSRPQSAGSHRHKSTDGDAISTGKNVIGDAFRFLEDFDDNMSIDADDRL